MEEESNEKFDELLTHMAGAAGGIEPLLSMFFSFLHRKTDFYVQFVPQQGRIYKMGFPVGEAENMCLKAFRSFPYKEYPKKLTDEKKPNNLLEPKATPVKKLATKSGTAVNSNTLPLVSDGTSKQVPIGNGGIGPNYYWTQTLKDVTLYVDIAKAIRGKDVKCIMTPTKLSLQVKEEKILDGKLDDTIAVEDSMWTISSTGDTDLPQVVISLEKCRKTWWKSVIEGHPEIDTSKVLLFNIRACKQPSILFRHLLQVDSTQNISEYDEATQAAIRKIIDPEDHARAARKGTVHMTLTIF